MINMNDICIVQYFKYSNKKKKFLNDICECSCLIHNITQFCPKLYHDNYMNLIKI